MNLLRGKIKGGAKPSFETEGGVALPLVKAPKASDGMPAVYGIRPEHLELGGKGVKAEISVLEPMGSETQVFAKLGGQKIVGVFKQRLKAKPGEMLTLTPQVDAVHLFDATSGQRL